jgi:hypothetical protein
MIIKRTPNATPTLTCETTMNRYINGLKRPMYTTGLCLLLSFAGFIPGAWASGMSSLDQALDDVSGMGDINIGGNLTDTCSIGGSNAICVGTYSWTDNHSSDASVNKGALILSGNAQEGLVTNINVSTTVSPTATGVNTVGTVDIPVAGAVVNMNNSNNATGFIGGF